MKARKLIEGASFDPHQLKAIGKAFDDAWEQIAPSVGGRLDAIESARLKLANVLLSLAKNGAQDPERLTEEALKVMFAKPTEL